MIKSLCSLLLCSLLITSDDHGVTPFQEALREADRTLEKNLPVEAKQWIDRALERDPRSPKAWALREKWAAHIGDRDEQVYAQYMQVRLAIAQKASKNEQKDLRAKLEASDPNAADVIDLRTRFVAKLLPVAERYEKELRPHSAIRIHRQILALDPDRSESEEAIQRLASARDPSLAESAKPKDLFADISDEWIQDFDTKHNTWESRAKEQREHYVTQTNTGYRVLIRAAEAMEQMNAFYREFFHYGTKDDGKQVSRIDLLIFKDHDEYLKLGSSPPEWSAGIFTGSSVQTYLQPGGFESTVGVFFHECAHQFVGLATSAVGWLNEGLASFFEGCRILANGTVLMNMPANHRLFELASRMETGWMTGPTDGIDPKDTKTLPTKSPTFRIVFENRYQWGPPWYAPTWGVVYFLYNYQDPVDGRFIYRPAFREFINKSGGRSGEGAVENFEEVVLAHPAPPTPDVDFSKVAKPVALPRKMDELDAVWKQWILDLRDEQAGNRDAVRPYLMWARNAITRRDFSDATEHFEKGLVATPYDVDLLFEFANHLATRLQNLDRASKLVLQALQLLEGKQPPDEKAIRAAEKKLSEYDPARKTWEGIHQELIKAATAIAQRYYDQKLDMMCMEVSLTLARDLGAPDMYRIFEQAARRSGKTLALWQLAYNEKDLRGWGESDGTFMPDGVRMKSKFGAFDEKRFEYNFLTLDTVTSGDFSFEAEVMAERGKNLFCGLVFGRKSAESFHALVLHPGKNDTDSRPRTGPDKPEKPEKKGEREVVNRNGKVDLTSFYGGGKFTIWRSNGVDTSLPGWHKMRIDITGPIIDVWFDGKMVCSQTFPNLDVLRGSFGLITGPGEAEYQNIRYLSRTARDPGALIERELRMKRIEVTAPAAGPSGRSASGSYAELIPPWPTVKSWVQNPRSSWGEKGVVPTLLAIWSIQQNDRVPINTWLTSVAQKFSDIGLEVVSVVATDDGPKLPEYLKTHPFPGAVGVDYRKGRGYGDTFEAYAIPQFNLPRLLLLDIDHKVVWEGDPGFPLDAPWKEGDETYLDAPLQTLIERRNLRTLVPWRKAWVETGRAALRDGDLKTALPLLTQAKTFDAAVDPLVQEARSRIDALESALDSLDTVSRTLASAQTEPALEVLLSWADLLKKPVPAKARTALKPVLEGANAKGWKTARELARTTLPTLKSGKEADILGALAAKLRKLPGRLPADLVTGLDQCIAEQDWDRARQILGQAETLPTRALVRDCFQW
jgi:hypothetical protein